MATRRGEDIEGEQTVLHNGHQILFSVRHRNFLEGPKYIFDRKFRIDCNSYPTKWFMHLTFQPSETREHVSCIFHFERNDLHKPIVDVQFWMKLSFAPLLDIEPLSFVLKNVPKNSEMTREFKRIMPFDYVSKISERGILIQVHMTITGCHREKETSRKSRVFDFTIRKSRLMLSKL